MSGSTDPDLFTFYCQSLANIYSDYNITDLVSDVWNKLKVETEIEDLELKKTYISKRESNKIKNFTSIPLHFPVHKIQDTHSTWFLVAKMEKAKEAPIVVKLTHRPTH